MGTPEFATAPLKALLENKYNVVGVITAPDKPAGRGKKLMSTPVKVFAEENGIKVFQPEKLKDPEFISSIKKLNPDIQIVVAFRMLPEAIWSIPRLGTFNLHASLLPHYRGAAPINHAIINGEKETGLTTFFIDDKIDTGEILLQEKLPIGDNETAGELHDRMMQAGSALVLKTVKAIIDGEIVPEKQNSFNINDAILKPAPKIFKADCKINLDQSAKQIHDMVRGLSPYPAAFANLKKSDEEIAVKFFRTNYSVANHNENIGFIRSDGKNYLKIAVKSGFLEILELQLAGKKRMDTKTFLLGFKGIEDCKFS